MSERQKASGFAVMWMERLRRVQRDRGLREQGAGFLQSMEVLIVSMEMERRPQVNDKDPGEAGWL